MTNIEVILGNISVQLWCKQKPKFSATDVHHNIKLLQWCPIKIMRGQSPYNNSPCMCVFLLTRTFALAAWEVLGDRPPTSGESDWWADFLPDCHQPIQPVRLRLHQGASAENSERSAALQEKAFCLEATGQTICQNHRVGQQWSRACGSLECSLLSGLQTLRSHPGWRDLQWHGKSADMPSRTYRF